MNFRGVCEGLLCLAVLSSLCGCGGGPQGVPVQGKVTVDSIPINEGVIVFLPDAQDSPKAGATIQNGEYSLPAEKGLRPGTYKVQVSWPKQVSGKVPGAEPGQFVAKKKEFLPARFNKNTTLTAEITSGKNVKDFELRTK